MAAVLADLHTRLVNRDLNDPGAELGFEAEIRQSTKGLKDGLLGDLFCISGIVQHAHSGK